jgi:glycosyltransferase involved in cell wall biosynthesis
MTKLTIGIPIYNGGKTISETLESIFFDIPADVEVLISDNASSDNTPEIIQSYCRKYHQISYYKNAVNLGPDVNFDLTVKRAAGEFVWLLGDDDEIATGGIQAALDIINKNPSIAALFVNYSLHDRNTGECLNPKVLNINSDILCTNANMFLSTATVYPNFMSSIIVRKSRWLDYSSSDFFGTFWLQYGMLMRVIENNQSFCIASPYVINRGIEYDGPNEANRNGIAINVLLNLIDIIDSLPRNVFNETSISKARKEGHKFLLRKIFSSKRHGLLLNRQLLLRMTKSFWRYPAFWLVELPLLITPRYFHYFVWRVYKSKSYRRIIKLIKR